MIDKSFFLNQKKITASIVTYNNADEIDMLMTSLEKSSSFDDMVIYVIDNASQDNTTRLIREKYPWAKLIKNKKNIGFGCAHNKVINCINSKYHIIINPDINLPVDTIAQAVAFMDENPDIAVIMPSVLNTDGTQQFLPKRNPSFKFLLGGMFENRFSWGKRLREEYTRKNESITEPTDVEFCTGAFMFTRTEMLQAVGGFDEHYFLHFEDADLTRELRKVGRAVYNPNIKVIHKWHRENKKINKSFWVALKSMFVYMKKWKSHNFHSSNYSCAEKLYNVKCVINTRTNYRGGRLIRTPITVRGKRYIDFGTGLTTGRNCQLEVNGDHEGKCLIFGRNVNIGHNVRIQCAEKIKIGNNVLIGSRVTIIDNSHGSYEGGNQDSPEISPNERMFKTAPITIEDNAWIGDGVVVQKGVKIGFGSIIAANSVVTKDIPSKCIVGGGTGKGSQML